MSDPQVVQLAGQIEAQSIVDNLTQAVTNSLTTLLIVGLFIMSIVITYKLACRFLRSSSSSSSSSKLTGGHYDTYTNTTIYFK